MGEVPVYAPPPRFCVSRRTEVGHESQHTRCSKRLALKQSVGSLKYLFPGTTLCFQFQGPPMVGPQTGKGEVFGHGGIRSTLKVLQSSRKVDVRLPGKGDANSHGARPVHLIITMIQWFRTSRLSIQESFLQSKGQ